MRYLIWDFDGTLGYREGMWSGTLHEVLCAHLPAQTCSIEEIRPYLGHGFPWHSPDVIHPAGMTAEEWWDALDHVFEGAFIGLGVARPSATSLAREVRRHYLRLERWTLYNDVIPALRSLREQGWRHLILSNHVPELGEIVEHLGLGPWIDRIYNSALNGYEKPHPGAFKGVIDSVENDAVLWMIGDSMEADIAGAAHAGIPAILVRKRDERARYCCDDLFELATGMENLVGA